MDTEVRQRTHTVAMVGRLAEQFRSDVHQARANRCWRPIIGRAEFRLPGGTTIKWRIDEPAKLIRTEQAPTPPPRGFVRHAPRHDAALELQSRGGPDRGDSHRFAGHGRAFAGDRSPGSPR